MDKQRAKELLEIIYAGVNRGRNFRDPYSWDDLFGEDILTEDEFKWCQENIENDIWLEPRFKESVEES